MLQRYAVKFGDSPELLIACSKLQCVFKVTQSMVSCSLEMVGDSSVQVRVRLIPAGF